MPGVWGPSRWSRKTEMGVTGRRGIVEGRGEGKVRVWVWVWMRDRKSDLV